MRTLLVAIRTAVLTLLVTGVVYPLVVTVLAHVLFPAKASGSLLRHDETVVGSEWIGQPFTWPAYLQSRPSAVKYDAAGSGGSNLGPTSADLRDRVTKDLATLTAANPEANGPVPVELVTTSASGLDPHLAPEAALWQAPRIARARGVSTERVRAVIEAAMEGRDLGFMGEPRVNVLTTNLALDRLLGAPLPP